MNAKAYKIELRRISYDSEHQQLAFGLNVWHKGKPFSVAGNAPMESPGDLPDSQLRSLGKQHLAGLLRDMADVIGA